MRSQPNESLIRWIGMHQATNLFIIILNQAEILYGLELLSKGKRRNDLKQAAQFMFDVDFVRRILSFDSDSAKHFATISAKRINLGRSISQIDAQITAITLSNSVTLATRNVADFD